MRQLRTRRVGLAGQRDELLEVPGGPLLESGAPSTLVALAQAGYGVAIVPSNVRIPRRGLRVVPLVQRGVPIGRWLNLAWDPRRFLAPYAERFVEGLVAYAARGSEKPGHIRRAPPLPRPKVPTNAS